ncbi:MAG: bifunctional riboflavin kinase/FAD synthetase [Vulcanimicrobiaceae bacterium]
MLTFANHPSAHLRPGTQPPLLTSSGERLDLLAEAGIEVCFFVPFDDAVASLSPQRFINDVLVDALDARGVVVGANFRFGQARAGDTALAQQLLSARGIPFAGVPNELADGERISSTRIRQHIAQGEMEAAETLLGHGFVLRGNVTIGEGRGHTLGFPTANLTHDEQKILPKDGVYAALARHDGRDYAALVSIGSNPTFRGARRTVEAWLRDFEHSIYGEAVSLRHLRFVREQKRFESADALREQMERDREAVAYPSYG